MLVRKENKIVVYRKSVTEGVNQNDRLSALKAYSPILDEDILADAATTAIEDVFGYAGTLYGVHLINPTDFSIVFDYADRGYKNPIDRTYYLLTFTLNDKQYEYRLTRSSEKSPYNSTSSVLCKNYISAIRVIQSEGELHLYNTLCSIISDVLSSVDQVVNQDYLMRVRKSEM